MTEPVPVTPGWVAIVGGGPGDPGLITRRGWALLQQADVVVADHLAPLGLLDELARAHGRRPEVVDAAKYPGGRSMPQDVINQHLVAAAGGGKNVVRLKGGDPHIFGRGIEEVWACAEAGIPFEVVPGVSSANAVPALAGVPVTHKDLAQAFTVVSGHVPPGHPDSLVDWGALAHSGATLVVLMGVRTMPAIAAALLRAGLAADTPTVTVVNGGAPDARIHRCPLSELGDRSVHYRPPAITVIGAVAALRPRLDHLGVQTDPSPAGRTAYSILTAQGMRCCGGCVVGPPVRPADRVRIRGAAIVWDASCAEPSERRR